MLTNIYIYVYFVIGYKLKFSLVRVDRNTWEQPANTGQGPGGDKGCKEKVITINSQSR